MSPKNACKRKDGVSAVLSPTHVRLLRPRSGQLLLRKHPVTRLAYPATRGSARQGSSKNRRYVGRAYGGAIRELFRIRIGQSGVEMTTRLARPRVLDVNKQLEIIRDPSIALETADTVAAKDATERARALGKDISNVRTSLRVRPPLLSDVFAVCHPAHSANGDITN